MRRFQNLLLMMALAAITVSGQQKDFLTSDEADQIRLAQEPNTRLRVYLHFAQQRVDLIEQALKKEKAGRAGLIHEYLEEYTKIVEAIDIVADDATKRKVVIDEGIAIVLKEEKAMLAKLRAIADAPPKDIGRYQFALTQALETTEDSLDMAKQDVEARRTTVAEAEQRRKAERESLTKAAEGAEGKAVAKTDADKSEQRATDASSPNAEQKATGRKPPTLRRKGETPAPPKP
ncbi:MAG: hypothetical protein NTZ56_03655 [Acidobacteria bacterium]|nr:hypothetical protein [Acidobacteriota bacterium]